MNLKTFYLLSETIEGLSVEIDTACQGMLKRGYLPLLLSTHAAVINNVIAHYAIIVFKELT